MTSIISSLNNTNTPLLPLTTFGGGYEIVNAYTAYSVALRADTTCLISVYQSYDGITADDLNTFVVPANTFFSEQAPLYYKYAKLTVLNTSGLNQTFISFMTRWMSVIPLPLESNVVVVGGSISLAPSSNTIGNVGVNNLITQTLATRRVDYLVVGVWYRVASVGLTTGAEWNAIGAIVDGESEPVIGRLFKCLSVGSAIAGGGECYDVEYTTDMSATVSGTVSLTDPTTVRVRDAYGDPITTTAGNLNVNLNAISTATPLHTIVDSGTVGIDTSLNTIKIDSTYNTVQLASTSSLPAGTNVLGLVGIDTTAGANTIAISQSGTQNNVAITGLVEISKINDPLPSGSNTIGVVGIDTSLNTIKIDSTYNTVKNIPPTALASNHLSASNTGQTIKASAGNLLSLFIQSDGNNGTNYVKIYNVATPTSSDTPIIVLATIHGTFQNVDCWNVGFSTAIGLRVSAGSSNADNTPPTNTINVNAFYV